MSPQLRKEGKRVVKGFHGGPDIRGLKANGEFIFRATIRLRERKNVLLPALSDAHKPGSLGVVANSLNDADSPASIDEGEPGHLGGLRVTGSCITAVNDAPHAQGVRWNAAHNPGTRGTHMKAVGSDDVGVVGEA